MNTKPRALLTTVAARGDAVSLSTEIIEFDTAQDRNNFVDRIQTNTNSLYLCGASVNRHAISI